MVLLYFHTAPNTTANPEEIISVDSNSILKSAFFQYDIKNKESIYNNGDFVSTKRKPSAEGAMVSPLHLSHTTLYYTVFPISGDEYAICVVDPNKRRDDNNLFVVPYHWDGINSSFINHKEAQQEIFRYLKMVCEKKVSSSFNTAIDAPWINTRQGTAGGGSESQDERKQLGEINTTGIGHDGKD